MRRRPPISPPLYSSAASDVYKRQGVHQDGLVHISQICDKYIKHPLEVVKVGDIVKVKVLDIDPAKKRISLTMKGV